MDDRRQKAESAARKYTRSDQLLKPLGAGAEGFVFPTVSSTAVKIFTYREKFIAELMAYERLGELQIDDVLGIAVPTLINADSTLLAIEMTLVEPPFLLDFAQSVLDFPHEFPEGVDEWWQRIAADFGDRFQAAQDVYTLVEKAGLYYYDLARNLNFGDDPTRI